MSSKLPYKQAANVERRTWDKETYEAKAKARQASENGGGDNNNNNMMIETVTSPGDDSGEGNNTTGNGTKGLPRYHMSEAQIKQMAVKPPINIETDGNNNETKGKKKGLP
eukprot:994696_1